MNEREKLNAAAAEDSEAQNRRDVVRNLGRFAVYAAPFTLLALKGNATPGAGGSGGGGLNGSARPSRPAR